MSRRTRTPKWFGVPHGLVDSNEVARISEATGESFYETFGRCVRVLQWLSQQKPEGDMPDAFIVSFAAGMFRPKKKSAVFAEAFVKEFLRDGKCEPYVMANKALVNTRRRQRETMARRRSVPADGSA